MPRAIIEVGATCEECKADEYGCPFHSGDIDRIEGENFEDTANRVYERNLVACLAARALLSTEEEVEIANLVYSETFPISRFPNERESRTLTLARAVLRIAGEEVTK